MLDVAKQSRIRRQNLLARVASKFFGADTGRTASPFTSPPTVAGKDRYGRGERRRQYPGDKNVSKETVLEYINSEESNQADFAIISITGGYDAATGKLLAASDKQPVTRVSAEPSPRSGRVQKQLIHVPREDFEAAQEIALPYPLQSTDRREARVSDERVAASLLDGITIFSKEDYTPLLGDEHDLMPYVFTDTMGNLSLNVETMPSELRSEMSGHDLAISTSFLDSRMYGGSSWHQFAQHPDKQWIGPNKDAAGMILYPPEIQQLVRTLQKKYKEND